MKNYKTIFTAFASIFHLCLNTAKLGIFTESFLGTVKSTSIEATKKVLRKIKDKVGKWEVKLNLGVITVQRNNNEKQQRINLTDALQQLWEQHLAPSGFK
ncbi:MAG: hypothetical protein LBE76_08445 [Nitrososphaerota archaeon]|nr:hypothetical protein [Nitrososphaerota archaeon]